MNASEPTFPLRRACPAPAARVDFLDGLRGWAALMVVLSHLWGEFARHVVPEYSAPLLRVLSDGHLAVVIFFILSGIALSLRFVRARRPVPLVRLVAGRYVRLVVPILGVTLIVYLLLALQVAGNALAAQWASSEVFLGARRGDPATLAQALVFATFDVLFRYDPLTTFDWSLWTMPIEFKGSLLIFALVALFSWAPWFGRGRRVGMAGVVCAGLFAIGMPLGACFFLGYLMSEALVATDAAPAWLGRALRLAPVVAALIAIACQATGLSGDALYSAWALTVVLAGAWWPALRRFLGNGVSGWLGRASFPLYLIHVPVIALCGHLFAALAAHGMTLAATTHVTVAVAFVAALAAARVLEPLEHLSVVWSRRISSVPSGRASPTSERLTAGA